MSSTNMAQTSTSLLVLAVLFLASASAKHITSRRWMYGECYDILTPNDFDLKSFTTGDWYEISRVYNKFEENADCVKVSFFLDSDANQLDIIFGAHFTNLTEGTIAGSAVLETNENETNIQATFPGDEAAMKLTVLSTDFNNYAILYSCYQISMDVIPEKEERMWVLGRKTYFSDEIQDIVDKALVVDGDNIGWLLEPTNQICKPGC